MHVGMSAFSQNPGYRQGVHMVWCRETAMADLAEPLDFDSVRRAEEIPVFDNLSDGRPVLGPVLGLGCIEFNGFRAEMDEAPQRRQHLDAGCDIGGIRPAA
jgi:hypothetical protein